MSYRRESQLITTPLVFVDGSRQGSGKYPYKYIGINSQAQEYGDIRWMANKP